MKFSIPLEREKEFFHNYMGKLKILQSRILAASVILIVALILVQLGVDYGFLDLAAHHMLFIESFKVSAFIVACATILLRVSTPLLDSILFFMDGGTRPSLLKLRNYGVWVISIFLIIAQFATGSIESFGISIGVFSAGLAIALQQPITSILAWFVIMSKKVYKIGDRIVVRNMKGDVVELTPFHTILREVGGEIGGDDPTGIKITLPNNIILTEPVLNYSTDFPYVWDQVPVSVTYESDIGLARELIKQAAADVLGDTMKKACERMKPYLYGTPQEKDLLDEPIVYTSFADSAVVLRVKYICRVNRRRKTKSDISERILNQFNQNKGEVTIAYPHTEVILRK